MSRSVIVLDLRRTVGQINAPIFLVEMTGIIAFANVDVLCALLVEGVEVVALVDILLVLGQSHLLNHHWYKTSPSFYPQLLQPEIQQFQ